MAQSFHFLDTPVSFPVIATDWVTANANDYLPNLPGDAVGLIMSLSHNGSIGYRRHGSSDSLLTHIGGNRHFILVGIDQYGNFDSYYLRSAYFHGYVTSGVVLHDTPIKRPISTANTWYAISGLPVEAIGGIYMIQGGLDGGTPTTAGVRMYGSTDARYSQVRGLPVIIGCDATRHLVQVRVSNTSLCTVYELGYITDGVTFNVNGLNVTPAGVSAWETDTLPALTGGGIYDISAVAGDTYGLSPHDGPRTTGAVNTIAWGVMGGSENLVDLYKGNSSVSIFRMATLEGKTKNTVIYDLPQGEITSGMTGVIVGHPQSSATAVFVGQKLYLRADSRYKVTVYMLAYDVSQSYDPSYEIRIIDKDTLAIVKSSGTSTINGANYTLQYGTFEVGSVPADGEYVVGVYSNSYYPGAPPLSPAKYFSLRIPLESGPGATNPSLQYRIKSDNSYTTGDDNLFMQVTQLSPWAQAPQTYDYSAHVKVGISAKGTRTREVFKETLVRLGCGIKSNRTLNITRSALVKVGASVKGLRQKIGLKRRIKGRSCTIVEE